MTITLNFYLTRRGANAALGFYTPSFTTTDGTVPNGVFFGLPDGVNNWTLASTDDPDAFSLMHQQSSNITSGNPPSYFQDGFTYAYYPSFALIIYKSLALYTNVNDAQNPLNVLRILQNGTGITIPTVLDYEDIKWVISPDSLGVSSGSVLSGDILTVGVDPTIYYLYPTNITINFYASADAATNGGSEGLGTKLGSNTDIIYNVPTSSGIFTNVTKWIVYSTDDGESTTGTTSLQSGAFNGTGTYYNLAPFGGVFYYENQSDIVSAPENVLYIDQKTIGVSYDVSNVDGTESWFVDGQLNGNEQALQTTVEFGDNTTLTFDDNSGTPTFYFLTKELPPALSIKFTFYASADAATNGGSAGTGPNLSSSNLTVYNIPPSTGVYAGVTRWTIYSTDDTSNLNANLPTGQFEGSGTYYNLAPDGGVFYYDSAQTLDINPENPLYIDQSTVNGANNVYQVVATSTQQASWLVNSQSGGDSQVVNVEVGVGDSTSLTNAIGRSSYYLVQMPPPNITFTFYASAVSASNGGSLGNAPRLSRSIGTSYDVPASSGVYAGVGVWVIRQTDDTSGVFGVGQTVNSLQSLAPDGNGTYYNLSPGGGVFYYASASALTTTPESPVYIDQVTVIGDTDVYRVLATDPPQTSWVVDSQTDGNSDIVGQQINIGDEVNLTGASLTSTYYLVQPDAPPPLSIRFTFYATEANATSGGSDGNQPRLDSTIATQYILPPSADIYAGVNSWILRSSDDTSGFYEPGQIITSLEQLVVGANGTYYNLSPNGGVFYYDTAASVTASPETPLYIGQGTTPSDTGVYMLSSVDSQNSWLVNSQTGGDNTVVGTTILLDNTTLIGATSSPPSKYILVKVPPPPLNITITFYANEANATNGGSDGNAPRLGSAIVTTYVVPPSSGVFSDVDAWIVASTDDTNYQIGHLVNTNSNNLSNGNGTYYNLYPAGGVFYYESVAALTNTPESPLKIDQTTVAPNFNPSTWHFRVVAVGDPSQTLWLVNSTSGPSAEITTIGETMTVGDNRLLLNGSRFNSTYYLVATDPPGPSIRFTFYASEIKATNGGPNGSIPRLASIVTTPGDYVVPASSGAFAGVTSWVIRSTDDTYYQIGTVVIAGENGTLGSGNGTYYNLSPAGGMFYYSSVGASGLTESPLYIDQSTDIDVGNQIFNYQVLGVTDPPRTSWFILDADGDNAISSKINTTINVGDQTLTVNNPNGFKLAEYYLIPTAPPPTVTFTFYASATNATNGGALGTGPRLAQISQEVNPNPVVPTSTGVYGGVTKWVILGTNDTSGSYDVGTIVTSDQELSSSPNGTYYNLAVYGGVFYYNTAASVTASPETPLYIDQTKTDDVYQLASVQSQTSWVVSAVVFGDDTIAGNTILLNATTLTAASASPPSTYYLVRVQSTAPPCFLEGSTILTDNGYVAIETIRPGMLVQTNLDGLKKVEVIGYSPIYNPNSSERSKNRLYVCKKENYPELTEDLVLTGDHSILVDNITDKERAVMVESLSRIFVTSKKYRLTAQADERSDPYPVEGTFNVWHLALENVADNTNYGIYANGGLLVESAAIKALKSKENVTLV